MLQDFFHQQYGSLLNSQDSMECKRIFFRGSLVSGLGKNLVKGTYAEYTYRDVHAHAFGNPPSYPWKKCLYALIHQKLTLQDYLGVGTPLHKPCNTSIQLIQVFIPPFEVPEMVVELRSLSVCCFTTLADCSFGQLWPLKKWITPEGR